MANNIVVDNEEEYEIVSKDNRLVSWVMDRVEAWEEYRDTNFKDKWDEYYRLWRGIWSENDKTRQSERSKLISPALQQAIEAAVAELEEATFGRGRWFDIQDDVQDQNPQDLVNIRKLLHEDLDKNGVRAAMSEIFLNGAIYGTGIGKIVVDVIEDKVITNEGGEAVVETVDKFIVKLVPIHPENFVIDPSARSVEEALGCAHIMEVPKHTVLQKQAKGIYENVKLGASSDFIDVGEKGEQKESDVSDRVKLIEYHGYVPEPLLDVELEEGEEVVDLELPEGGFDLEADNLVEAIVTIANDGVLLRAVRNPYTMGDRCILAYQHDTVPNRFWGCGVAEKGYNPQKALDAELRARIDAMALSIHPMMAVDATRIPRGGDFSIRPGKTILTQGDPNTVLRPFNFGQVGTNTFHQSGELERMIQMGTGSMDSATPVGVSPRNSTASGMSMIMSGAIKRSKRTLANIERLFTKPFVHKAAWRYMQFDPERYPPLDIKFKVDSTLGIMAREFEQAQLTQLLQTTPPDSPGYWLLIKGIYNNSSITDKEEMLAIAQQMLERSLNPQPPQPTPADQLKAQEMQIKTQERAASLQIEKSRADTERARVIIEAQKADSDETKKIAEAILALAKAEAEEAGTQLNSYKAMVDAITAQSTSGGMNEPAARGTVQ